MKYRVALRRAPDLPERVKEVKDYIEGDSMQKYAGLQLEGIIGGSSTS